MGIINFVFFICLNSIFPYPCEHPQDATELKQVIDLVKGKVAQFISVECKGEFYYKDTGLRDRVRASIKNRPPNELEAVDEFEIAFTCDKKNFFISVYNSEIKKDTLLFPEKTKPLPSQEEPTSALDIVKKFIEEKSKENYQFTLQQINNGRENKHQFRSASYMKDGQIWSLLVSDDMKEVYLNKLSGTGDIIPFSHITPLNMVGRVGDGTEDNLISTWGISLTEFLDLPGPFHLHHEGEYTILWHRANYFEDSLGKEVPLSLDIWIDQKGDIRRIDYVEYYGRIWTPEDFQKCRYEGIISCMTPKWIDKSYFFNDYTVVSGGIRFPLKAKEEEYYIDTNTLDGFQLDMDIRNKTISVNEYYIKRCFMPTGVDSFCEILIFSESLRINKSIPEEVFTAPPITETKDANKIQKSFLNVPFRAVIFVGFGVMIVLVLMYLTHRYLGWSFF